MYSLFDSNLPIVPSGAKNHFIRIVFPLLFLLILFFFVGRMAYENEWYGLGPQPWITAASVFFVAATFALNAWNTRIIMQEQFTLKVLFDSRLSAEFRADLLMRETFFKQGERVDAASFMSHYKSIADVNATKKTERDAAHAAMRLLNYYEFLSMGMIRGDLNEDMLKHSIGTIMCNFVADFADVIAFVRDESVVKPASSFVHLREIYHRWKGAHRPRLP